MAIRPITANGYEVFLSESEYAVVLFDASWDIASKKEFRPRFEAASKVFTDRVVFGEIDCDVSVEVARSIPILNVPTVAYYRRGVVVAALVGRHQDVASLTRTLIDGGPISREGGPSVASTTARLLKALLRRSC